MVDLYSSPYRDVYGSGSGGGGPSGPSGGFDGVRWPKLTVMAGVGAGGAMVDVSYDSLGRRAVRSFRRGFGRNSPIDSADPGTATIVFDNRSGDYDPVGGFGLGTTTPFTATASDTTPTLQGNTYGGPSTSGCTNSVVTLSAGGVLHDMGGASAASPNGTNPAVAAGCFSVWNDQPAPDATYNWASVRWRCRPDLDTQTVNAGYYWANQGAITSSSGDFGNVWYAGLQSKSALSGNPKAVNFAIWGGVDGVSGGIAGTVVAPFSGEGTGYQCLVPYSWVAGRTYGLHMAAEPARGPRWFALYIKDETTGIVTWLGSLRAGPSDSSYVRGVDYQFSELFSQATPATTCPLLPRATTWFGPPTYSLGTGGSSSLDVGTPVHVVAEWPLGTLWDRFTGTVTDLVLDLDPDPVPLVTINCADGLEQLGRTQLPAGLHTFTFNQTGDRIYDLATMAEWSTTARDIELGLIPLWPTMELGATVLDLMQQVELTEMGLLYVTEDGTLTFRDRNFTALDPRSTTVQLALHDTNAAGVRMAELSVSRSRDAIYNDIFLTREPDPAQDPELTGVEPGDEPTEQSASDTASISRHGHLNLPAEVGKRHTSDAAVRSQANVLLEWYSTVQDRIDSVTINALHPKVKADNLTDDLLGLTLLDRISVSRNYGPAIVASELLVQRIEEEWTATPPGWTLTLTTATAPPTPAIFILGTSVLGTDEIGW